MNTYKTKIVLLAFALVTSLLWSQNSGSQSGFKNFMSNKSELSVYGGIGLAGASYNLKAGTQENQAAFLAGLRYRHYLNEQWSVSLGAELAQYKGTSKIDNIVGTQQTTDAEGDAFEFRYTATTYREDQKLLFVNIPITAQFETQGRTRFYIETGGKIGFSAKANYTSSIGQLQTSGYYEQWNAELHGPLFMGFGTQTGLRSKETDIDVKTALFATIETGVKYQVNNVSSLYLGVYLEYGLTDIFGEPTHNSLIEYQRETPSNFGYNSVWNSENNVLSSVDNYKLFTVGIKLGYAFDWRSIFSGGSGHD